MTSEVLSGAKAVSEAPLGRRPKVISRGYDHVRLGAFVARPDGDWMDFLATWEDLPADKYVKEPHPGRFRRYGRYAFDRRTGTLEVLPHVPFFQRVELNSYAGGIQRDFAPIVESTMRNRVMQATLHAGIAAFVDDNETRPFELGVHQIRVVGKADHPGSPTPEGLHRDGYDFVAVHLVNRKNVSGGESILRVDGVESRLLLSDPLETLFIDDNRCLHAASAIQPTDPSLVAARDTLIVTYHYERT